MGGGGSFASFFVRYFSRRGFFCILELSLHVDVVIMAPSNDIVSRSHSATEGSIEKPTFNDGDKALEFLRSQAEEGETDLIDEKQLVRKIDFMIV
jgi:hypothetical protein